MWFLWELSLLHDWFLRNQILVSPKCTSMINPFEDNHTFKGRLGTFPQMCTRGKKIKGQLEHPWQLAWGAGHGFEPLSTGLRPAAIWFWQRVRGLLGLDRLDQARVVGQ